MNIGEADREAIVIFYGPDDQVVAHGTVDDDGLAHGFLPDGGTVTVIRRLDNEGAIVHSLFTVRDVEPGDTLVFEDRPTEQRTGAIDTMGATYTPLENAPVAMFKPCSPTVNLRGGAPLSTLQFYEGCTTPTFDLLVLTQGAFVWMPDVPYLGGGTVTVPDAWLPIQTITTEVSNAPAQAESFGVFVWSLIGTRTLVEMTRGTFELSSGAASVSHPWPVGGGRGAVASLTTNLIPSLNTHVVYEPGSPSSLAIDLAALPLPLPNLPTQTATSTTWTEVGPAGGDLRIVNWRANFIDLNQIPHLFFYNELSNPAVATSTVSLLPLPTEYEEHDATKVFPVALILQGSGVSYIDYDNVDGYEEARSKAQRMMKIATGFEDGARHVHLTASN